MELLDFCNAVHEAVENYNKSNGVSEKSLILQAELEKIVKSNEVNKSLCMTQATILFEGFYRHLSNESLKSDFQIIRAKRWEHHFGTPTITFLLSFKTQIDQTTKFFDELTLEVDRPIELPWDISKIDGFKVDLDNNIVTDPKSVRKITFIKYAQYANATINGVIFFKDLSWYYPVFNSYMYTLDAYKTCMNMLAYGNTAYCESFKTVGQYVYKSF